MTNTYKNREDYLENKKEESRRARKRKSDFIKKYRKPCLFCSSEENIHFHHINANEKDFDPSRGFNYSWSRLELEIKKCWCLCANCHNKLHKRLVDPLPECYHITDK